MVSPSDKKIAFGLISLLILSIVGIQLQNHLTKHLSLVDTQEFDFDLQSADQRQVDKFQDQEVYKLFGTGFNGKQKAIGEKELKKVDASREKFDFNLKSQQSDVVEKMSPYGLNTTRVGGGEVAWMGIPYLPEPFDHVGWGIYDTGGAISEDLEITIDPWAELGTWGYNGDAADIDGDHIDDLLFVDPGDGAQASVYSKFRHNNDPTIYDDFHTLTGRPTYGLEYIVRAGNLDTDATAETLIIGADSLNVGNGYTNGFYGVLDDGNNNFTELSTLPNLPNSNVRVWEVEILNLDSDYQEEIIVIYEKMANDELILTVLDDFNTGFTSLAEISIGTELIEPDVTIGNVDIDFDSELLIILNDWDNEQAQLFIFDDYTTNFNLLHSRVISDWYIRPGIVLSDLDLDSIPEIIVSGTKVIGVINPPSGSRFTQTNVAFTVFKQEISAPFTLVEQYTFTASPTSGDLVYGIDLVTQNMNLSPTPELIVAYNWVYPEVRLSGQKIRIFDLTEVTSSSLEFTITTEITYEGHKSNPPIFELDTFESPSRFPWNQGLSTYSRPYLITGEFDGDATISRFIQHTSYLTDPKITALLAAPPNVFGIDQNTDDTFTNYGVSEISGGSDSSTSVLESYHWHLSVGIGAEITTNTWAASFHTGWVHDELTKTLKTTGNQRLTAVGSGYETDYSDDYIVVSTALYDAFLFEVTQSPNLDLVGSTYMLHLPTDIEQVKMTLTEYHDLLDQGQIRNGIKISDEFFKHVVGDPRTYKSEDEARSVFQGPSNAQPFIGYTYLDEDLGYTVITDPPIYSPEVSVGRGSGTSFLTIDRESTMFETITRSHETSNDWYLEGHIGTGAEVFDNGARVSLHGRVEFGTIELTEGTSTTTVGDALSIIGSVGDIDSQYWNEHKYTYGMMVYWNSYIYPNTNPNTNAFEGYEELNSKFIVIDYWVEDYKGSGPRDPTDQNSTTDGSVLGRNSGIMIAFSVIFISSWKRKRLSPKD